MGSGLHTTDGDLMRRNQERDVASAAQGDGRDGGARVPGNSPAEVPADNRDPGTEIQTPDGDNAPAPGGDTVPTPDTTSPTPAPTEVPQTGRGGANESLGNPDTIASNTRGNSGLGNVVNMHNEPGENSTEAAMKRATEGR